MSGTEGRLGMRGVSGAVVRAISFTGCSLASALASAGQGVDIAALEPITVTATRVDTPGFEVPASVTVIGEPGSAVTPESLGLQLSELLSGVPGLLARERQNYAQDTQISIRGFGARSTFGIRGVRLYLDGIPASQPDGQGQVSHLNLLTAERVEILRGPFSALYGNASGGVIQAFTAPGSPSPELSVGVAAGSDDTWRGNLRARGSADLGAVPLGYTLGYTHFRTDGYRDHSRARRDSLNGKLSVDFGGNGRLSLVLNDFSAPEAQDPQGLTRDQFEADPTQASSVAETYNTRKSVEQTQAGVVYESAPDTAQQWRLSAYGGRREVLQFLSIPPGPQAAPTHSGGVIDLNNDYAGADLRWHWRGDLLSRPLTLVAGVDWETLSQHRRGYENFVGDELGVRGELRRDEQNDVDSLAPYLQVGWLFAQRWSLLAGVRHNRIRFDSADDYITPDNPDDSGRTDYSATTPVFGLMYRHRPELHWYASYGRGFETPTFAELAYRNDGEAGLNLALDAARSDNLELGAKLRLMPQLRAELALFQIDTRDEIVVASNSGGRSTYTNASRTRRRGLELSAQAALPAGLAAELGYTWLDARLREGYLSCSGVPCATPDTPVDDGMRLPGVPRHQLFGALRWQAEPGWQLALDGRYLGDVAVNDRNTEFAPAYAVFDLMLARRWQWPSWGLRSYVRIDNLLDRTYSGSVIVNDGNGRYYEPAPDRSVLLGLTLDWSA